MGRQPLKILCMVDKTDSQQYHEQDYDCGDEPFPASPEDCPLERKDRLISIVRVNFCAFGQDICQIALILFPQHFPHGNADRVYIASCIGLPVAELLRRGVALGPQTMCVFPAVLLDGAGCIEVNEADEATMLQDEVRWLDVPMDNAMLMQWSQPITKLEQNAFCFFLRQTASFLQPFQQGIALDKFLDYDGFRLVLRTVENPRTDGLWVLFQYGIGKPCQENPLDNDQFAGCIGCQPDLALVAFPEFPDLPERCFDVGSYGRIHDITLLSGSDCIMLAIGTGNK